MARHNDYRLSQTMSTPSSRSPTPQLNRPLATRLNSGRSTLRSAVEQLRDIRQGDTSWQRSNSPLLHDSPNTRQSNSSASVDKVNEGSHRVPTEPQIRVYLHHVQRVDTMPLIVLAYEISASDLKKANRLWAADSIQTREKLYLPVDKCKVNATTCPPPLKREPTASKDTILDLVQTSELHERHGDGPTQLSSQSISSQPAAEDVPEEWVMIPGIGPIQIVSFPAQKLSYFPTPQRTAMERSTSLPGLDALVAQDRTPRESIESVVSRSSIGSLVEDGVGRIVRFWHDNDGRKRWAKIGSDSIEL
jgi:hypothetical protein